MGHNPGLRWIAFTAAVTAAVTAVVTLSIDRGLTASWSWIFPGKPATKIVPVHPVQGSFVIPHGFALIKPDPTCYRFSFRVASRYVIACVSGGVRRDPCNTAHGRHGAAFAICYDAPWRYPSVGRIKKLANGPASWSGVVAKRAGPLSDPLAIELSNGERCLHMPNPDLEQQGAPQDSTYVCDRTQSPPKAQTADGFVYGTLRRGRVWKATYVAVGNSLGNLIDVRTAWIM
jgi:hypothetical protein